MVPFLASSSHTPSCSWWCSASQAFQAAASATTSSGCSTAMGVVRSVPSGALGADEGQCGQGAGSQRRVGEAQAVGREAPGHQRAGEQHEEDGGDLEGPAGALAASGLAQRQGSSSAGSSSMARRSSAR